MLVLDISNLNMESLLLILRIGKHAPVKKFNSLVLKTGLRKSLLERDEDAASSEFL